MAAKDFELVLRVQADLQTAVKELRGLNDNMRVTKTSAQQAGRGIDDMGRSTKSAEQGIHRMDARLKGMGSTVRAATGHLKALVAVVGVAFVVHRIAGFTRSLVDANEQLFQLAKRAEGLNVSVKFFSGLSEQADDLGINVEKLAVVFGTLNRQIATAKRGSATARGMFSAFGIDASNVRNTEQAFLGIADSVAKYGLNAERAGILTQIFGATGKEIVPILKRGADAIRSQNDAMEKTGQIITDSQVPAIVQLHNATDQVGDSFTALRNNLIIQLAPSISRIADQFNEFVTTHGPALTREIAELVDKLPEVAKGFMAIAEQVLSAAAALGQFVSRGQEVVGFSLDRHISGDTSYQLAQAQLAADKKELAARQQTAGHSALRKATLDQAGFLVRGLFGDAGVRTSFASSASLQAEVADLERQIQAYARSQKPTPKNAQEGDTRGLFVGLGGDQTAAGGTAADPAAAARAAAIAKQAAAAQRSLTQSLIDLQGQLDPTAAIYAKYNAAVAKANEQAETAKQAAGANAHAIDAQRDAVVELEGTIRDAALDQLAEKDRQAWDALKRSFETPAQVAVDDALKKIAELNELLKKGVINSGQYHDALGKIGTASVTASPQYQGLDASVGGVGSELSKNFAAQAALEAWHQQQLDASANFHATSEAEEEAHQARLAEIDRQYAAQRNNIERSRGQLALQTSADIFGQLATLSSSHNRKIATIGKAAAIAQTIIKTYQSATEAYASLAGIPYIGPALGAAAAGVAIAAGLANVAQIRAQPVGGYREGGYTGPGARDQVAGVVHAGEGVLSQPDIAALGGPRGFEVLRLRLRGYADGGYVHPLANAPSPAAMGMATSAPLPMGAVAGSAANDGAQAPPVNVKTVLVQNADQLAAEILNTPTGTKLVIQHVGDNPRTIQGKWSA